MIRPLQRPQFLAYVIAVVISSSGSYAATVALSFGVLAAFNPATLAIVLLAREIATVVLVLAGGVISDRVSRRSLLGVTSGVQAISQLASAALLGFGSAGQLTLLLLVVCAAINGGATACARPAMSGIVPEIAEPSEYQAANALLGTVPRLIGIAGAALGAFLVSTVGAPWGLAFDAATFVIASVLFLVMGSKARPRKSSAGAFASFSEGWRVVKSNQWIWAMILSFGVFQVAYFPAVAVLGPTLSRSTYGGAGAWALLLSGSLVGGLVGLAVSGLVRPRSPLVVASLVGGLSALQLGALSGGVALPIVFALSVLSGVGLSIGDTLWSTVLQHHVDENQLGRVSSFDWAASLTLNPLGYALIAPIAATVGTTFTLIGCACLLLVAVALPLLSPNVRSLRLPAQNDDVIDA